MGRGTASTLYGMAVLAALVTPGCTHTVDGVPAAAAGPPSATTRGVAPAGPRTGLDADVVSDECLLDATQFAALLGEPVLEPENLTVHRGDGSSGTSCWAHAAEGFPTPIGAINVYTVRTGTPADFVRAAPAGRRRDLPGAGEAAALVDTGSGPTLQLASPRYLVTIIVLRDRGPADEVWRAAARQALARLDR
ncbi:hypothetical protein ACVGVM_11760 [Pseudonocardia bannensis]|uniref:DUF3558 domain-containing protein n=1 Tax=Pseudonocardia bannensis TaxID=630973 RepID=A0A848DIS3_9PSEU|nr:hypothetical protein [Pseudonocardia bannensis]NMH92602.1 hypothetical protein [Pseudonocardia bannensis]